MNSMSSTQIAIYVLGGAVVVAGLLAVASPTLFLPEVNDTELPGEWMTHTGGKTRSKKNKLKRTQRKKI
jgi:hypothetical protein